MIRPYPTNVDAREQARRAIHIQAMRKADMEAYRLARSLKCSGDGVKEEHGVCRAEDCLCDCHDQAVGA